MKVDVGDETVELVMLEISVVIAERVEEGSDEADDSDCVVDGKEVVDDASLPRELTDEELSDIELDVGD